jgi:hypothetical protein
MANFDKYVGENLSMTLHIIRALRYAKVMPCKVCTLVTPEYLESNVRVWYDPKTDLVVKITHG